MEKKEWIEKIKKIKGRNKGTRNTGVVAIKGDKMV
jgi:hypothetical protein